MLLVSKPPVADIVQCGLLTAKLEDQPLNRTIDRKSLILLALLGWLLTLDSNTPATLAAERIRARWADRP